MTDVFGELVAPWNVEVAVLETIKEWMPSYLAELERKNRLEPKMLGRPPSVAAYRGGLDWLSVKEEWMPAIIAVANPVGEPERSAESYTQNFHVEVGCVLFSEEGVDPEGAARMRAGFFGAAVMGILVGHGGLGSFGAQETVLTGSPRVEFLDDDLRKVAVGVTGWSVYVETLNPNAGPLLVKEVEPEGVYPEDPDVTAHRVAVVGESVETPL